MSFECWILGKKKFCGRNEDLENLNNEEGVHVIATLIAPKCCWYAQRKHLMKLISSSRLGTRPLLGD